MFVQVKTENDKFTNAVLTSNFNPETEGQDHINISPHSKERVGLLLHPTFQARFTSIVGTARSIEDYVAYFVVEGYNPADYQHRLGRSILKQAEHKGLRLTWPVNYHAILFLGMVERMFTLNRTMSTTMIEHFKNYVGQYTSYNIRHPSGGIFSNKNLKVLVLNQSLAYYVKLVEMLNDVVYNWNQKADELEYPIATLKKVLYETALDLKTNKYVPIFADCEHVFGSDVEDMSPDAVYEAAKAEEIESSLKKENESTIEETVEEKESEEA